MFGLWYSGSIRDLLGYLFEFLILWLFDLKPFIISQFFYQLFLMRIENLLFYV